MCGIFAYLGDPQPKNYFLTSFNNLSGRGPDDQKLEIIKSEDNKTIVFGFHRLAINDLSSQGNQPMKLGSHTLICNGEIFNYQDLIKKNNFSYQTSSDCEVILHMYQQYGVKETVSSLDAEFSFVLYDSKNDITYAARDPFGVRPLFKGTDKQGNIYFSSEMKGISELCQDIERFPPGCFWNSKDQSYERYYDYHYSIEICPIKNSEKQICDQIRHFLTQAVDKRLMSERPIGCLLSGGLDSSLIASIISRRFKEKNQGELNTFSIGMPGSSDLKYAQMVSKHIGSKHHHIELSSEEFLKAIPEVIYATESYDTTTIRASVGNYLVGKYIKEKTDITVVFNGDGSDEQSGYLYLRNAPDEKMFQQECISLLKNIHMFDCLRSDRSISSRWSLESRTPFLDKEFVNYYMSIDPRLKMYSKDKIEKYLLRKAFEEDNYLPNEVLWRPKEAFSDGCSSNQKSWYKTIQDYVDLFITDQQFQEYKDSYTHNPPQLKESLYYRQVFETSFEQHSNVIDFFWLPKWCGEQIDPSARELSFYKQQEKNKNYTHYTNILELG